MCCSPRSRKGSDTTEQLHSNNMYAFVMENIKNAEILKKKIKAACDFKTYIKSHFGLFPSRLCSVHILRCTHTHTYIHKYLTQYHTMIHYIYDYAFITIYLLLQNLLFSCNNYKHFLANKSLKAMTKSTTIKKKREKKKA